MFGDGSYLPVFPGYVLGSFQYVLGFFLESQDAHSLDSLLTTKVVEAAHLLATGRQPSGFSENPYRESLIKFWRLQGGYDLQDPGDHIPPFTLRMFIRDSL